MCLATPIQIRSMVQGLRCKVDDDKIVDVSLVSDAKKGDRLICHGNMAINKIDAEEAKTILDMIKSCQHQH